MKKFLIGLSIVLFLIVWYLLYTLKQVNDKVLVSGTWDYETISQLEKELSIKIEELSGLQMENQELKDELSWTIESLNSLQLEKSGLEESLSWCENKLDKYIEYIKKLREENNSDVWDIAVNISNNNSTTSNVTRINWKELWKITQVYTDGNWNKKIDITYGGNMVGWDECGDPSIAVCYLNESPKKGTFTVSDNVQIFTYSFNGYVDEKRISFDSFEQKFKETNNDEYGYFKFALFRITIENNIVVKIEEQYLP